MQNQSQIQMKVLLYQSRKKFCKNHLTGKGVLYEAWRLKSLQSSSYNQILKTERLLVVTGIEVILD